MGLGGGFLAAIFASEAYVHGGFLVLFAIGVFVMVGLAARLFGQVRIWAYCLTTLCLTALLVIVGIP